MPNPKVPETVDELVQAIKEVRDKLDRTEAQARGRSPQTPLNEHQQSRSAALTAIVIVPQDLWEC